MNELLIWITISSITFFLFLFFLLRWFLRRRKVNLILALVFFILTILFSVWLIYLLGAKTYFTVAKTFKPRNGNEIYSALFEKPNTNCVKIVHFKDQVVPGLDCCIWLEFRTCPGELERIISKEKFKISAMRSNELNNFPGYSTKPGWWNPNILGDSVFLGEDNDNDPNRNKILFFSKDSLHAFYCDMAD